jgi:hypothetical protein
MHTEPKPVQPQKPPLLSEMSEPVAEELENVTIRVVRLDQLGPQPPPTRLPAPPAPQSAPPRSAPPSVTPNGAAASPAPAPAARNTEPAPTAPARIARPPAEPIAPAARPPAEPVAPAARAPAEPIAPPAPAPSARGDTVSRPAPSPTARQRSARVEPAKRGRTLTWNKVGFIALVVVLYLGWTFPTERYITPTRGFGYWLGIIGGSLMLLLLVYSARKHFRWLRFLGPTPAWFRFHMVLGIAGPLCILFHSNFKTGAANSNVALFSMLTVASSGFIGRYLYAHIHYGLYGRKLELGDLQASASGLRELSGSVSFLPDLVTRLEVAEQRLLKCGPQLSLLGFLKPLVVRLAAVKARWQLHRYTRRGLRASARTSSVIATEAKRLRRTANAYIDRRLAATRRVAEFQGYERLFSLWHALHIPLIFMLIIAAIVHVIAVNVY